MCYIFSDCTTCPKYSSRTQQHPNRKWKHVCLLLLSYRSLLRCHNESNCSLPAAHWSQLTGCNSILMVPVTLESPFFGSRPKRDLGIQGRFLWSVSHTFNCAKHYSFLWFLFNILAQEKNYQK